MSEFNSTLMIGKRVVKPTVKHEYVMFVPDSCRELISSESRVFTTGGEGGSACSRTSTGA